MEVGQKRALGLLYILGLVLSLFLSFYNANQQKIGLKKLEGLIFIYRDKDTAQVLLDFHQAKVNIFTQGMLKKNDAWVKEIDDLGAKELKTLSETSFASKDFPPGLEQVIHQQLDLLKRFEKASFVNLLKTEKRYLSKFKFALNKKSSQLQKESLEGLKEILKVFSLFGFMMSGLFTIFIFLINLNKKNLLILEGERKKRDFMLDALDCAVLLVDKNYKVISFNKKCLQIWSSDNIQSLEGLFDNVCLEEDGHLKEIRFDENPLLGAIKMGALEKGISFQFQIRGLVLQPQWYQVEVKSFKNELFLISLTNTTHLFKAKELIKKQQKSLVEQSKMTALGQMSGGMAHEINNPLAIISSEAEELLEIAEEVGVVAKEDATSISQNIKKTTDRIARIIRGLRIFSRTDKGGDFEYCSFKSVIEEVLTMTDEKFRTKGVKFEIDTPQEIDSDTRDIYCNEVQIIQVLVNLLNNAYDAVKEQRDRKVYFSWKELPDNHLVLIKDNGPGVAKKDRERIFDPFFTTKAVGEGTGLGLSLSRSIIEEHGGELILNDGDDGACFQVKLPKKSADEDGPGQQEEPWAS